MSVVSRVRQRFFGSAASTAAGVAIGSAAQPSIRPRLQSYINSQWEDNADVPISAEQAAQAALIGAELEGGPLAEAKRTGTNETRFNALRQIAANPPALTELLTLRNRNAIDDGDVDDALRLGLVPAVWRPRLRALRWVLPSVTDMVRFAVREVFNPAQRAALDLDAEYPAAFEEAAKTIGIQPEQARDYWAAHWELPSREEGAQMMFRGEISPDQYDRLLKALDYAPTWRGPLREIARAIPTLTDMIRFAVREVYNPQQRRALRLDQDYPAPFTAQAAMHGLSEEHARDYWAAHWRLPSPEQGYRMLHRSLIDTGELDDLLKADDYAPSYREHLRDIAYLVPGRIDLRRMYAHGVIKRDRVYRGYLDLGYKPSDAELLTQFTIELAQTQGTGTTYTHKAQTQLWTQLHRSFVGGESDETEARATFDAIGVPADQQDDVLELWTLERDLRRRTLTPAQVKKAFKNVLIDRDTALARLLALGYSEADAELFLDE